MIQRFVVDALECVTLIEQALDTDDLAKAREGAHGLKGISRNMGATALAQVAVDLETACQSKEAASAPSLRITMQDAFQSTRQALDDRIKKT